LIEPKLDNNPPIDKKEDKKEEKLSTPKKVNKEEENKIEIDLSKSNSPDNNIEILEEINDDNVIEDDNSVEEIISSESKSEIEFVKEVKTKKKYKYPKKKYKYPKKKKNKKEDKKDNDDDDSNEKEKKVKQPKKRGRKTLEEEYKKYMEMQKKKIEEEVIENKQDESDIISIEEEDKEIINMNNDQKTDSINTPYNKLLQITKEYGIGAIIDRLIGFVSTNDIKFSGVGISKDITKDVKDIIKSINLETLNLYLIKLLACSQKKNFKILNDFKMANDENFVKYVNKRREGKNPIDDLENETSSDESEKIDDKDKLPSEKENNEDVITESSDDDDESNDIKIYDEEQYRYKHFVKKNDGTIYCYIPKRNNVKSMDFNLYCSKYGCKGRIRINLEAKIAKEFGEHSDHGSVDIGIYKDEFPEIEDKDWTNLQYDVKNSKPMLVWKYNEN
jgi:hypothetical protein